MVYEFLTGGLPFHADTPEKIFKNIHSRKIEWPPVGDEEGMLTKESKDLIDALLQTDPLIRLGTKGINQIKSHPFF